MSHYLSISYKMTLCTRWHFCAYMNAIMYTFDVGILRYWEYCSLFWHLFIKVHVRYGSANCRVLLRPMILSSAFFILQALLWKSYIWLQYVPVAQRSYNKVEHPVVGQNLVPPGRFTNVEGIHPGQQPGTLGGDAAVSEQSGVSSENATNTDHIGPGGINVAPGSNVNHSVVSHDTRERSVPVDRALSSIYDSSQWNRSAHSSRSIERIRTIINPNTSWSFEEALASIAINKTIILAMIDDSQGLSVRNFYENSIVPLGLSNTLFVSTSRGGCKTLLALHIPCVLYGNFSGRAAVYGTTDFLAKMNVRTRYTLRALELGYSILQTDTDMVYFKDPFPYFIDCTKCYFVALEDGKPESINAGFVYIRASNVTVDVYREMYRWSIVKPTSEDQKNLNSIMTNKKVAYQILDTNKFLCGKYYYERPSKRYFRSFAADCPICVVVHNNWIVSTAAKVGWILRFQTNV